MSGNLSGALPSPASQHSNSSSQSKPAPLSLEQSRQVARTHFDALKAWLQRQGALNNAWTRSNAREKLTRLTRQQFQELSTDVYDELVRRSDEGADPFLAVRNDFHPKRNQARQKLATLPLQRFKDLASDVYYELDRRYPEFNEDFPSQPSSSAGSHLPRSDSVSRSTSAASSSAPLQATSPIPPPPTNLAQQRRAPTPLGLSQNSSNDVVVPNKSTLVIEESAKSPALGGSHQRESSTSTPTFDGLTQHAPAQNSSIASVSGASPPFSSEAQMAPNDYGQDANRQQSPPNRPGHTAQASEASSVGTRFIGGYGTSSSNDSSNRRNSWDHEAKEKLKADYEYKLTMLQSRIGELEREVVGARGDLKTRSIEQARLRDLEDQLRGHRERNESQSLDMRNLRSELERLSNEAATRSRGDHDRAASDDLANELRAEVGSLVDELREVNAKYEDAVEGLNRERQAREKVEDDARMWKKKYEQTKTELRNLKATSQVFTATIKVDNDSFMPASPDGLLADVHISEFQTSIDDLLDAARSKEPSSVLTAARAIVSAVEKIDSDVQAIDPQRISALPPSEQDALAQTKDNIGATLSNLMTASKNHAMSFGVSPVSLVDAAASHVSMSVVELVRILKIGRTVGGGSGGRGLPSLSSNVTRGAAGGFEPMPSLNKSPDVSNAPPPPAKQNGGTTASSVGSSWTGGMNSVKNVLGNFSLNRAASTTQQLQQQQAPASSAAPGQDSREGGMLPSSLSLGSLNFARTPPPASSHGFGGRAEPTSWEQQIVQVGAPSASSSDYRQHNPQTASPIYGGTSSAPMPNAYGRPSQHDDRFASPQPTAYNGSDLVSPNSDFGGGYRDSRDESAHQQQLHGRGSYDARDSYRDQIGQYRQGHEERVDQHEEKRLENNADELKNYIENQTEAIVHSIQSLLGAIRGGAQAEQLNENLTQIITIVSSIVAISRDALPLHSRPESEGILQDLAENCDKLSEMQSLAASGGGPNSTAFNKQTKQSMASASFGVAKSLKQLNGLLATRDDEENF